MNFVFNGISTKIIIRNTLRKKHACNNTYLRASEVRVTVVGFFFDDASIIFINKTDPKDSTRTLLSKQNFFP